jgi:hypothetical protein
MGEGFCKEAVPNWFVPNYWNRLLFFSVNVLRFDDDDDGASS